MASSSRAGRDLLVRLELPAHVVVSIVWLLRESLDELDAEPGAPFLEEEFAEDGIARLEAALRATLEASPSPTFAGLASASVPHLRRALLPLGED